MFIGLCKESTKWPSILYDLGYNIQLIEYPVILRDSSDMVKPDVVAVSDSLTHVIVADCKSGSNIKYKQDNRYQKLTVADLHMIDVSDRENLKQDVCYIDTDSNHDELEPGTKFPFITFKRDYVIGFGTFATHKLTDALNTPTSLKGMKAPMGYYPFAPDDDEENVIEHVMSGLISCLSAKGQEIKIDVKNQTFMLEMIHRIYPIYDVISNVHKQELEKKIKKIISICKQDLEFKEQMEKIQENGNTFQALDKMKRICINILTNYQKQKRINDKEYN